MAGHVARKVAGRAKPVVEGDEVDLSDPILIPPSMRKPIHPSEYHAELDARWADVEAGRVVGTDPIELLDRLAKQYNLKT